MKKKTGVLLVNLGTPDSPAPSDVYRYLIEFLTDARVIDSSWISRQLLVRGLIVPRRYKQSAKFYQKIWTAEGSPLKVYGNRVEKLLQERLGDEYVTRLAMRYQSPSIQDSLNSLIDNKCEKIIVLPLFPQYASATTGSVHQNVMEIIAKWQNIPEVVLIDQFAAHPALIKAFCAAASAFNVEDYDHVLFSFHGLPQRQLVKADRSGKCCMKSKDCCATLTDQNQSCYSAQCYATAHGIIKTLGLSPEKFSISFQSRLGKEPWLQPYTGEVIGDLAKQGKKRVLVFCPSFVCDCLETIHEIGVEYAEEFQHAGGESLTLVPGLNDHPQWIDAIVDFVKERNYAS
ncbi:MAG TPA: ferrochelatase [Parachlamydiaceae bacterium]|nr:ferrochelatase [Parachlamydiaceae bacterium]